MTASSKSTFDQALERYQQGAPAEELIDDFIELTRQSPHQSSAWTCLAWLQLLLNRPLDALQTSKKAVRLNPQDPQARVNLSLAMLDSGAKGVRTQIEVIKRFMALSPELSGELRASMTDGLKRRPDWKAIQKVMAWLSD